MSSQNPHCSIVIPVYGNSHLTRTCLDSLLRQHTPFETQIIVVDDASPDDTLEMLATYGDRIEVVRRPVNGGYAKACNSGLAAARGDFVLFLNNDTESDHQWLATIVAYAEAQPRAGLVSCRLLYPNGTIQHAGVGFTKDLEPVLLYYGHSWNAPHVSRSRMLQAVIGAVSLSPRFLLEEVGGYDEGYINGLEDVDLCFEVRNLGYEVHYCADAILTHHETSTRLLNPEEDRSNWALFLAKWNHVARPDILSRMEEDGLASGGFHRMGRMLIEYDAKWIVSKSREYSTVYDHQPAGEPHS